MIRTNLLQPANMVQWVQNKGGRVIQFPEWPQTCERNFSPPRFKFRDINVNTDRKGDWDWLFAQGHAPDLVISDRAKLLMEYLTLKEMRKLNR